MCGIAGFAGRDDDGKLLEAMTGRLRHRGPDGPGYWRAPGVGLGAQRLAIIDPAAGPQPVFSQSRQVAVVLNGEIYNFGKLRAELERRGVRFRTRTDTEVVAALFELEGPAALERLSGMFALAVWDARDRSLTLARDPLGVKPLYYSIRGGKVYFGSEIKAVLEAPEVSRELDLTSLTQYLDFLYIAAPRTIYRGVAKLRAGEALTWRDGKASLRQYWQPRIAERGRAPSAALDELDRLLDEVVADQLVADVPIGLFLSGGLDSTTLAHRLSKAGRRPEAFCAFFAGGGDDYNETDKARVVARHFGLPLTELKISPNVDELLDTLIDAFDEPLADSSALPTYWISWLARQRVTVALTGIGGDEVFGGYPRYLGAKLLPVYRKLPFPARRALGAVSAGLPAQLSSRNVGGWARRFLSEGAGSPERIYSQWLGHLSDADKRDIFGPALAGAQPERSQVLAAFAGEGGDFLKRVQSVDLRTYLPDDLLAHADRMSMKVGLELRVPLCDVRLVEFVLGLSSDSQVHGTTLKPMLKALLRDRVPLEILSQRKQGFMIPLGPWFQGDLRGTAERGIAGLERRGLLSGPGMRRVLAEHVAGHRNRTDALWSWVLLDRWLEVYAPDLREDGLPRARRRRSVLMVSDEIFPDSGGGGLGRGAWQESLKLAARGHDVRLLTLDRRGGLPENEVIDGLRVYRLDAGRFYRSPSEFPWFFADAGRQLDRHLSGFEPDVVIGQSPLATWLVQRRPELERAEFIYRYNSSWPEEYAIDRPGLLNLPARLVRAAVEKSVIARAKGGIAAISDFMNRNFAGHFTLPATTLAAGIDLESFALGDKAAARKALGVSGEPLLVTVRNLRPRMGWDILFGAIERLRGELPGLRCVIVGSGPLEAQLREDLARRGLNGAVTLAGRVEDDQLPLYYQAADLFVLPTSRLEGLGLVLLEALACGTRCVGTPIGGIPEVLAAIDPGWVAAEPSPEAFAEAIRRGLASPLTPEQLREHVKAHYGWNRMAEGLEAMFERKPRLLHLVTRLDFGGSAENVVASCRAARRGGFEAAVATGPSSGPAAATRGVPVVTLPLLRRRISPFYDCLAFFQIAGLLWRWRPDVLHTHSSKAGVLGRAAAALLRLVGAGPRLVVHTPHGHVFYGYFGPRKSAFYLAIERAAAPFADALVALTEGEMREHLERGVGRPEQWSVVPSGVALAPAEGKAADLALPADAVVVGCVARLEPVKGVDVLVEAAAAVRARARATVRFLIVGDGPQAESLRGRAAALGLSDRFVFAGYQSDPTPFMRRMHVYVQPSRNEGMGKALVQAQALGLPAAASRVCGIPDVVKDGETGLLVPPEDPAALAEAVLRLVDDEPLRRRLGEAARRWAVRRDEKTGAAAFGVETMALRLQALYKTAVGALLLALALGGPARGETLRVGLHVHSEISHGGREPLSKIAARARQAGLDVLIPTDTFSAEWRYGIWPLRRLASRKVVQPSVLAAGLDRYLEEIRAVRAANPGLLVIPGVEVAPYYRWSGLPWRGLTIHDWSRHMLVVGPEQASAYAALPALGNPRGFAFDPSLLWPLAPLALGIAGWAAGRRRRFVAIAGIGLLFLADAWPFRPPIASPYAKETPWAPYQAVIDQAHKAGALVFWAHPDAPNWHGPVADGKARVTTATEPYPDALLRTSDYDGFAALREGLRGAGSAGGTWDQVLALYLKGQRPRPPWALGELDFRDPAQTRIGSVQLVLDAASRDAAGVLKALAAGRFYSIVVDDKTLALSRFRLTRGAASAGAGETLKAPRPRLELELANADGSGGEASVEIVRDGEVVERRTVSLPGRWVFDLVNEGPRSAYRVVVRSGANNLLLTNPIFAEGA